MVVETRCLFQLKSSNFIMNDDVVNKKEDLTESTGVMPAEYPPKVKLELFSQL